MWSPPSGGVCVNTPRNTGKWFLIGTFSGQCHKTSRQMVRISKFSEVPFFGFPITTCPFCKFSHLRLFRFLTYLFPTNFKQGALGPTSKPEPTKTLEVWDVQTYLQFSDNGLRLSQEPPCRSRLSRLSIFDSWMNHSDFIGTPPRRTTRNGYVGPIFLLSKCFKRGLWDAIPLPRTTPDKHVELSSVCVCVCLVASLAVGIGIFCSVSKNNVLRSCEGSRSSTQSCEYFYTLQIPTRSQVVSQNSLL